MMKPLLWLATVGLCTLLSGQMANAEGKGGLKPVSEDAWDYAKARHLLARAGFGGTPEEVEKLHAMGLRKAVDFLVDYQEQPAADIPLAIESPQPVKQVKLDRKALAKLSPKERQKLIQEQRKQTQQRRKNEQQQFAELRQWWMKRLVESPRPLEEKLVLFWHGHFATGYRTVKDTYAMYLQNELFRKHAAGSFGQLLRGIAHDPAMLRYLDNDKNVKARPNENLAREILELFSMGEGNYSEEDIKEAARALTGYTFDRRSVEFMFRRQVHDDGEKTIFGKTGNWDGDKLVDLILEEPATARFIARKLFVFFVHEDVDEQTIEQLAGVLRENDYELAPLLKTMFLSEEFNGPKAMGTQIKSPVQLVVGVLRSLGVKQANYTALAAATQSMGQELLQPPNVKGWDGGSAWINTNTVFARHNFAAPLVIQNQKRGKKPVRSRGGGGQLTQRIDIVGLLEKSQSGTPADVVDYLAKALLVTQLSEEKREELVNFLNDAEPLPPSTQWKSQRAQVNAKLRALLVLMMSMPEYQLT
ncbi:MAG TPA: DUF1800 domain-containing protein [Pirellulaceae bacterium]|nr:DUF1800 domain-containing protein [Pirellulaceae bacterium]